MTTIRISTIRKAALTLGLAFLISTVAISSSFAYSARTRQMCMGDAFRLCSSEIPNIARITACMWRNKAYVSPGCRIEMDKEADLAKKANGAPTAAEHPTTTKTKPAQALPAEQRPTTTSPVELPAARETKPAQTAPVKPTTASPAEQPEAREAKPAQTTPVEQTPIATSPVEQPAAAESKPTQAAPAEQKLTIASPVGVKPVEGKSAARGRHAMLARRKQKRRQLTAEQYIHREFRYIERTISFALPVPFFIQFYW